jgi:hypothetical protein
MGHYRLGPRRSELYAMHINQAEVLYGIAALPEGRRRPAFAGERKLVSSRGAPPALVRRCA